LGENAGHAQLLCDQSRTHRLLPSCWRSAGSWLQRTLLAAGAETLYLQLDFDVDAGGEIELHQCIDRLGSRVHNVQQALVGPDLKLLTRLLVDMGRAVDGKLVDSRRQRDRAANL